MASASPVMASDTHLTITLSSDTPGAVATARHLYADRKWVDRESCTLPCTLRVRGIGAGPFRVEAPDGRIRHVAIPYNAWRADGPVSLRADFARPADSAEYSAALAERVAGPDRRASVFDRGRPRLEPRARRSGWCVVTHAIDAAGYAHDLAVRECSEKLFSERSLLAVAQRRYLPRVENGRAVATPLKDTLIRYVLNGRDGKPMKPKRPVPQR